jgi:hypothetical protein
LTSNGFSLEGPYTLWWSQAANFDAEKATQVASGDAGEGVVFEVSASFTVPEAPYGDNYVRLVRQYRPDDLSDAVLFKVKPDIKVKPAQAKPGDVVTILGTGFPKEDSGTIKFDGEITDVTFESNKVGSFTAKFTLPEIAAGQHEFIADSARLYTDTASITLNVGPYVTMEPENPVVGTEVTVTGRGFTANSKMEIAYDDISIADSPLTDELGSFSYSFDVPETSGTDHIVVATDEAGNSAMFGLPLEVKPPPEVTTISPKDQRIGLFGNQTVVFTWTEASDPSGITYTVEIADNLNFFPLKPNMRKSELTDTSCKFTLEPGTYYWRVQSVDGAGNESEWTISPYAFKVGLFSIWIIVIGGAIFLIVFVLLIRAFFRRLREYYH